LALGANEREDVEKHKHILGFDIEAGPVVTTYDEACPDPVLQDFEMLVLSLVFT
jgi:hypothetical protein